MGLNPNETFPLTMQVGSTTFNLNAVSVKRKLSNKPLIVNKPMIAQNGVTYPETLYKDLKIVNDSLEISARVYSQTIGSLLSPWQVAELVIDKLQREAPPIVVTYRGVTRNCVFSSFDYADDSKSIQYWKSSNIVIGGTNSPNFILCNISLIVGSRRI